MHGSQGNNIEAENGTDGENGTEGGNASSISIELKSISQNKISIIGNAQKQGGRIEVKREFDVGRVPEFEINARGGHGGKGGNGGKGGAGHSGKSGTDATQEKYATFGEGGSDGGNGGAGGSGGNGGSGSVVTISVDEKDVDLLLLLNREKINIEGGNGGGVGTPGKGSYGGLGGKGGAKFRWADSHWNRPLLSKKSHLTQTWHEHPAGSCGVSGKDGSEGNVGMEGKKGEDGRIIFRVKEENGECRDYSSPFQLNVEVEKIEDDNGYGIIEPDSFAKLWISHTNNGEMSSPKHQKVNTMVKENEWFSSSDVVQVETLSCGQKGSSSSFSLFVKDKSIRSPDVEASLELFTKTERIHHKFGEFEKKIPVGHPAKISSLNFSNTTFSYGEESIISFDVENLSQLGLGSNQNPSRILSVSIQLKSSGDTKIPLEIDRDFALEDESGKEFVPSSGISVEIPSLSSKSTQSFKAKLKFKRQLPYGSQAEVHISLFLGHPQRMNESRLIQVEKTNINASDTYAYNQDDNILLVTNENSQFEEIESWKELISSLGMKMSTWNIPNNGHFDFNRKRSDGRSLAEDFRGKTVVILNNGCKISDGSIARTTSWWKERELVSNARDNQISFLIFGEETRYELSSEIVPQFHSDPQYIQFKDEDEFLKRLEKDSSLLSNGRSVAKIPIQVRALGEVWKGTMVEKCSEIRDKVKALHPHHRYVLAYNFLYADEGFLKSSLGDVIIVRSLDDTVSGIVQLNKEDMHSKSSILNNITRANLVKSLNFHQKLEVLDFQIKKLDGSVVDSYLLNLDAPVSSTLLAILSDLYDEQYHLRSSTWNEGAERESLQSRHLEVLKKILLF
eukprot:TRINITY_DN4027_c0_g1_i1.p1 TRINITY_DN4027_c0_g1~~TRINITY_DN4027_c0_g1_i1.p1  ORF type:complete len:894 (+),score=347.29 TRINITY_DN4027_c0_g1_i1:138-2684(+)